MLSKLLLLVSLLGVLSACAVKGPDVVVSPPEVEIDPGVKIHPSPGAPPGPRHCPPGHAKKGGVSRTDIAMPLPHWHASSPCLPCRVHAEGRCTAADSLPWVVAWGPRASGKTFRHKF
jgi:hypothetical protein